MSSVGRTGLARSWAEQAATTGQAGADAARAQPRCLVTVLQAPLKRAVHAAPDALDADAATGRDHGRNQWGALAPHVPRDTRVDVMLGKAEIVTRDPACRHRQARLEMQQVARPCWSMRARWSHP